MSINDLGTLLLVAVAFVILVIYAIVMITVFLTFAQRRLIITVTLVLVWLGGATLYHILAM